MGRYTEWRTDSFGDRYREKLSGFECVNDDADRRGDFCDICGDCVACFGDWAAGDPDGHVCRVFEYE